MKFLGQCLVDLTLLLDNSGSVGETNWQIVKSFAKKIALNSINYGQNLDHLGVITFSSQAKIQIPLGQVYSQNELNEKIDAIPFDGQFTNLPDGIIKTLDMYQNPVYGARAGKVHVVALIIDEKTSDNWINDLGPAITRLDATNIKRYGWL